MIIDFGSSYQLECIVKNREPSLKLIGRYDLINCHNSSDGSQFTYMNVGFLSQLLLDMKSNNVIKYSDVFESDSEVLVSFRIKDKENIKRKIYIYFNLGTGEVGYNLD